MSAPYAAFLKLAGRRCVVVGGGAVAERKALTLVACDASVLVIAPRVTDLLEKAERDGRLKLLRRPYVPGDLHGAFLAFAATDDRALNGHVVAEARESGALANSVNDPESADFIVPATIRRGDLTIAISTGGRSPGFAAQLRQDLESWLTPARLELLELLADLRTEMRAAGRNPGPEVWRRAVDPEVVRALEGGDRQGARSRLLATLSPSSSAASG